MFNLIKPLLKLTVLLGTLSILRWLNLLIQTVVEGRLPANKHKVGFLPLVDQQMNLILQCNTSNFYLPNHMQPLWIMEKGLKMIQISQALIWKLIENSFNSRFRYDVFSFLFTSTVSGMSSWVYLNMKGHLWQLWWAPNE